jgi:hypothetical protein
MNREIELIHLSPDYRSAANRRKDVSALNWLAAYRLGKRRRTLSEAQRIAEDYPPCDPFRSTQ